MTGREKKLGIALVVVAVLGAVAYAFGSYSDDSGVAPTAQKKYVVSESLTRELNAIRAAEAIEDPEQSCLATPDLAEFSWDRKLVKAMCHFRSRQMITWNAINEALEKHNPELLQQTYDVYLEKTYKRGEHGFLGWTFAHMFQSASKEVLDTTTKWIDEDPASAYALAARGTHYVAAAYDARGISFTRETPPENFGRMHEFIEKGRADLDESLRRNPRLIASYDVLLRIAQLTGDTQLRRFAANKALALDPYDQAIYDHWIDAAEPKWGGSLEEMQMAADRALQRAHANPLLSRVQGRPQCYLAQQMTCGEKCERARDDAAALALFRKSAETGPTRCFLEGAGHAANREDDLQTAVRYYSQAVRFLGDGDSRVWRDDVLFKLGETDWAMQDLDKLLKDYPQYTSALSEKAYILELSHRPAEAESLYLKILEIDANDERAALQLSRLYLSSLPNKDKAAGLVAGLIERNPKLARAWLYKAALANGDSAACLDALEKYLQYVDRGDAYEQSDIRRAQARVDQLKSRKA